MGNWTDDEIARIWGVSRIELGNARTLQIQTSKTTDRATETSWSTSSSTSTTFNTTLTWSTSTTWNTVWNESTSWSTTRLANSERITSFYISSLL